MPCCKLPPKKFLIFLSLVLLISISFLFDYEIVKAVSGLQNPLLNEFMVCITYGGSTLFILFFLTSLLLWHERKRRWIIPLWLSLFFSFLVTSLLKFLVSRPRPYQLGFQTVAILKTSFALNSSFPSLHAAAAFSALPILDKEFPRFKFFWIIFACLVAFSRVYFSLHYLSDVIVGALIGYSISFFAVRLEEKYKYSSIKKSLRKKKK